MRFLPRVLTHNWQLKLSAIALAVLLWTVPRFETPSRQTLPGLPVRVQLNDPNFAVLGLPDPDVVDVTFSGPARQLFSLAGNRPTVLIPIDQVAPTDTTVALRFQWVRMPDHPGVVVEGFSPSNVRLSFEPIVGGTVPPLLRVVGSLPDGLALTGPVEVSGEFIRVSGPSSRVSVLDSIPLQPFDLSGLTESGSFPVPIDTTDLSGLQFSPPTVTVVVSIEEAMEVNLPDFSVEFESPELAEGYSIQPERVSLDLIGARGQLERVETGALRVVISMDDIAGMARGEMKRVPVRVVGIPSVVQAVARPDSVSVRRPA